MKLFNRICRPVICGLALAAALIALPSISRAADTTSPLLSALSERWSFRRVQSFCRASIAATEPEPAGVETTAGPTGLPLFSDGQELLIRRGQVRSAAPEERAALLQLLSALVEELRP